MSENNYCNIHNKILTINNSESKISDYIRNFTFHLRGKSQKKRFILSVAKSKGHGAFFKP